MAQYTYKHMTPQEFARNLDEQGLTLSQFCRMIGEDYETVRDGWLQNGTVPIPHYIRILFALLALPGASSISRMITDAVVMRSKDFIPEKAAFGHGKDAQERQAGPGVVVERKAATGRRNIQL